MTPAWTTDTILQDEESEQEGVPKIEVSDDSAKVVVAPPLGPVMVIWLDEEMVRDKKPALQLASQGVLSAVKHWHIFRSVS